MLFNIVKGWLFSPVRMMLKLAFWGLIIGFICLVIFFLTFNLNSFKGEIETAASGFLKRELKINGDVKLGLEDMRPSIILNDVKMGEDGKTTVVLAERLEVVLPFQKPDPDNPFSILANLENLRIDGRPLGDYDIPVRFHNNGVEIIGAKGAHGDSGITADIFFDKNKFRLRADVDNARYEELETGVTDGAFKANISLDAKGPDFLQNLEGHIDILGGEGTIEGSALSFWAGDLLMRMLTSSKKETDLECAVIGFDVRQGVATSRVLIIDTADITVFGSGKINLADQYVDMLFTPKPKNPTVISLATPMRMQGRFGQVKTTPDPASVMTKIGGLFLGAINPAAALLPMMKMGTGDNNPCLKHMGTK